MHTSQQVRVLTHVPLPRSCLTSSLPAELRSSLLPSSRTRLLVSSVSCSLLWLDASDPLRLSRSLERLRLRSLRSHHGSFRLPPLALRTSYSSTKLPLVLALTSFASPPSPPSLSPSAISRPVASRLISPLRPTSPVTPPPRTDGEPPPPPRRWRTTGRGTSRREGRDQCC